MVEYSYIFKCVLFVFVMSSRVEGSVGARPYREASRHTVFVGDHMFYDTGKVDPEAGGKAIGYVEIIRKTLFRVVGMNGVSLPYSKAVVLTRDGETLVGRKVEMLPRMMLSF